MTKCTKGQIVIQSKEQIIHWFEIAGFEDCRINAYPAFLSDAEEQDYKKGINLNLFAPNILFIDLDEKNFESRGELDRWLRRIQKNIANVLYGTKSLTLWSGHGYHIIIPVKATEALEQFEDFKIHTNEPSKEFLRFAERSLSLNKSDPANNPSFKSCLLRVPYTFNSKCVKEKIVDAEAKIIQKWDSTEPLPDINNLLIEFQTSLIDRKLKVEIKQEKLKSRYSKDPGNKTNNIIGWIEKLFEMALEHNREYCVWRIFAPYLINVKKLVYEDAYDIIEGWLNRCSSIRKLDFDADYQIKYTLNNAMSSGYLPIAFNDLKTEKPDLYNLISSVSIING